VIDSKDSRGAGHSERVVELASIFGNVLGLSKDDQLKLRWAASVHDLGKVAIPTTIFNKVGKLTRDELNTVRMHAEFTDMILKTLSPCPLLEEIADIASSHHERFDGAGYPKELAGEEIPVIARVLTIADAFEAMTSHRQFREALPLETAMKRLKLNAGSQFDPEIVYAILDYCSSNPDSIEDYMMRQISQGSSNLVIAA
jgi:HD-GYP domain-containing protein (c-di-GMP phosphodiesterase class II)